MAWRIVRQPDGLYARFSEVVDDFTDVGMTRDEAYELCRESLGISGSESKIQMADDNPGRYKECLEIIQSVHAESPR